MFTEKYQKICTDLKNENKYRQLQIYKNDLHDKKIDYSSNDYLCLSKNFDNIDFLESLQNKEQNLFGATGSRLLSGNYEIFEILEKQIAIDKNTEKALIFNSGYQSNFSCLNALLNEKVLGNQAIVFFDKSNHASLYQGVLSNQINLQRYIHSDLSHLEKLLNQYKENENPKFIITESIFGMDGDISNIKKLIELASKHRCFLYFDEAHATGVFGKNGYGLCSNVDFICKKYNFEKSNMLIMGTFSKGVGTSGAYVAGSETIINFLINKASGFIYSTAMSPIIAHATLYNWKKIKNMNIERMRLCEMGDFFRQTLRSNNFDTGVSNSHIIPIIINDEERVLKIKNYFLQQGIIVSAIRPPTVQKSCIRIGLNIENSKEDLQDFINHLNEFVTF